MENEKLIDDSKKEEKNKNEAINDISDSKEEIGENVDMEDKDNDEPNGEQILSNTREEITFSQMDDSMMSRESCQTYQSIPFKEDNPDLDLPNFSPTKYQSYTWRIIHSLSSFLFASILAASTWFYYSTIINIYHISLTIANIFYVVYAGMEWNHFKNGCIGESNLNSKMKKNIDTSIKAKLLRSEFGVKYFLSLIASILFVLGNICFFITSPDYNVVDNIFIDFNLCGMLILALSQIMKIEKILIENKTNSVKRDFSKLLVEILIFFGALLYGKSYMIQMFYLSLGKIAPFYTFYLVIRGFGNALFFVSSLVLQYRYYLYEYKEFLDEDYSDFN